MSEYKYVVATDGGCAPNPGQGAYAYVVQKWDAEGRRVSEYSHAERSVSLTTNNVMELCAVYHALDSISEHSANVTIITDSQNVIGWLSKGWKRNEPKIQQWCGWITALVERRDFRVTFEHVRSHIANNLPAVELNRRCDAMCRHLLT